MKMFDQFHRQIIDLERILSTPDYKKHIDNNTVDARYLGSLDEEHSREILELLDMGLPLFDITSAAIDVANNDLDLSTMALPRQRLPYKMLWAEYLLPRHYVIDGKRIELDASRRKTRCGAVLREFEGGPNYLEYKDGQPVPVIIQMAYTRLMMMAALRRIRMPDDPNDIVNIIAKSMIEHGEITEENGSKIPYMTVEAQLFNNDNDTLNQMYLAQWMLDEDGYTIPQSFSTSPPELDPPNTGDHIPFMWAVGLLNCVNIETTEEPAQYLGKKQLRKGGKGHVYKTLRIKPTRGRKKPHDDRPVKPSDIRGHLVRGHFKHYTDDAPLFGRYTGTWFWGAQYRGDSEIGVVNKSYEVTVTKQP